jgi:hypothetical protein
MSAPRLTGRPRVEALVACGAHQIHTQGKCTREVGGRERGRGRQRERACVQVPLSCGGCACTILLQEGGGAQSCSQPRHVNEHGPIALTAVCRHLRCDLGPETSTYTAHQLLGELAIPVPEYRHPHMTINCECSRDAPGPTNSLPLRPLIGSAERRPHCCSGHQHGSDGWHGMGHLPQDSLTRHRHGSPVRAQHGTTEPVPRARARTTRHARTCNCATVE